MKCNRCGAEYQGNFCPSCGAPAEIQPPIPPQNPAQPYVTPPKPQKPKKPIYKKWWFYGIIVILLIVLVSAVAGGQKSVKIDWSEMVLGQQLPEPPGKKGEIYENSADMLHLDIRKVTDAQYTAYIDACKEMGFTVDPQAESSTYDVHNSAGYKLHLSHYDSKGDMGIQLEKPMEMTRITWPTGKAGRQLPVPKSMTGRFDYEYADKFCVYIGNTDRVAYDAYVQACADKGFTVDYDKGDFEYRASNAGGWLLVLKYEGYNIMSIDLSLPENAADQDTTVATKAETTKSTTTKKQAQSDGVRADFKAAMDSYEAFMDEYVAFMKKYKANPSNAALIADYAKYMKKYTAMCDTFEKWEGEDLSAEEMAYYIDVQARVSKKLVEVTEE